MKSLKETTSQQYRESMKFDVLKMATYDIILGMPWLEKNNPVIDWQKKTLRFKNKLIVKAYQPGQLELMADERLRRGLWGIRATEISKNERLNSTPITADTEKGSTDQKASNERTDKTLVPNEYKQWIHLFKEERGKEALPMHQPWDH